MTNTKQELIKCPECGSDYISIVGTYKIYRGWLQQGGLIPCFYDWEDFDYEPLEEEPPELKCYTCDHIWLGDWSIINLFRKKSLPFTGGMNFVPNNFM